MLFYFPSYTLLIRNRGLLLSSLMSVACFGHAATSAPGQPAPDISASGNAGTSAQPSLFDKVRDAFNKTTDNNAADASANPANDVPEEVRNLPPVAADVLGAPPIILPVDPPRKTKDNLFKRLKKRFWSAPEEEIPHEPTISVSVSGAPALLERNLRAYLQRTTVDEMSGDYRDVQPRLRTLARQAAQAVGYYSAQFRFEPQSTSRLHLVVVPGEPVKVKSEEINIEGPGSSDIAFDALKRRLDLQVGDPFQHDLYETTKSRLAATVAERGYFDGYWLVHDVAVTLPDNTADILLGYHSGERYKFGPVEFKNIDPTKPLPVHLHLLEQMVPYEEGDPYDSTQLARFSRNLLDTRWFNNVEINSITPPPLELADAKDSAASAAKAAAAVDQKSNSVPDLAPSLKEQESSTHALVDKLLGDSPDAVPVTPTDKLDTNKPSLSNSLREQETKIAQVRATKIVPVTVIVDARKPNSAEVGLGYGTDTGMRVRSQFRRALLNDRGHSIDGNVEISKIRQALDLRYAQPYKHPLNDTLTYVLGYERQLLYAQTNKLNGFETRTATVGVERAIKPSPTGWHRKMSLRYRFDELKKDNHALSSDVSNLPAPFNVLKGALNQQALLADFGLEKTSTSGGINPVRGLHQFYTIDVAGKNMLSDTNFAILQAGARGIYSFGRHDIHQLVGRVDVGGIVTQDFDRVPYNLRFFAGGDQSIRGYDYKSLSPLQQTYLVGGQTLAVGSVEYNYQFKPNWRGAVFTDVGNAFGNHFNGKPKVGIGFGVRFASPVGPIRVDIAAGVSETKIPIRLHFFIGPPL